MIHRNAKHMAEQNDFHIIARSTMKLQPELENEWLETDGLGAFASGTSSGVRTRRYHNVLMIAKNPPSERVILVNGFDAWVETPHGTFPISTQSYRNDTFWPEGFLHQHSFDSTCLLYTSPSPRDS